MKKILMAAAALMLLSACDMAPKDAGCADCEKMAMEANAKHKAEMAAPMKKDCKCCKGGMKHAH